ncbi:MAG: hypothetical protein ACLP9L_41980 [Thermoguttaceae bacterium]
MASYAQQVEQTKLYRQLGLLVDREDLKASDVAHLQGIVTKVAEEAGPRLALICQTFPQYTMHDFGHVCNVIDLIYDFLPKQDGRPETVRLNAVEVALLLLSAILHDVGMYVSEEEKQAILDSAEYETYLREKNDRIEAAQKNRAQAQDRRARAIEDALLAEFFRRLHPERARSYIESKLSQSVALELRGTPFAADVALLCESHGWGVRESVNPRDPKQAVHYMERNQRIAKHRVNLQYLACCLRLADVLDFDRSRTPLSVYEEIDFTEDKSVEEWNKHLSIQGWQVDPHHVMFRAACTHAAYYVAVHDFFNYVDTELRECRYLLDEAPAADEQKYALTLNHLVDRRHVQMKDRRYVAGGFRFQLEYEEILRLLMDKSLYPDATLLLRELLQNSLDACRYQEALAQEADMADKYKPRIRVWDHSEDEKDPRIVFQDNGIGMSLQTVENFFLRIGKSFYRSPEFEAEKLRLAAADPPIHLGACSQFGIGFLSCFLGGDLIEVETFRNGYEPLKITITGPSKYFLIERLARPADSVKFQSPKDADKDGPPNYPGTRVTVHLRAGWHTPAKPPKGGIVHLTLDRFAVNQDYDIHIVRSGKKGPSIIRRRRWDDDEPLLPVFRDYLGTKVDDVGQFLAWSRVPLEKWEFCDDIRGGVWLWLLKDVSGGITPRRGAIRIDTQRGLEIDKPELRVVEGFNAFDLRESQREAVLRKAVVTSFEATDPQGWGDVVFSEVQGDIKIPVAIPRWVGELFALPIATRAEVIAALKGGAKFLGAGVLEWYTLRHLRSALLHGDLHEICEAAERVGKEISLGGAEVPDRYRTAIFGINVPACIIESAPMRGTAKRKRFLPRFATARIDGIGSAACRPSASRLFIPFENADPLILPISRAIVRHAHELMREHQDGPEWVRWYRSLVSGLDFNSGVIVAERELLADFLPISCQVDGKWTELTPRQIRARFGRFVPLAQNGSGKSRDGIQQTEELARSLPRREGKGGLVEVDIGSLVPD